MVVYRMETTWKPTKRFLKAHSDKQLIRQRDKYGIKIEGEDCTVLMKKFSQMRLPGTLLDYLERRLEIHHPSPIQMQGIPLVLSGRDMIGVAHTGSGKSLVFILPIVMFAIEAECSLRFLEDEGPLALVVVPSRELAKQIYEQITKMSQYLHEKHPHRYPSIRVALCIGGTTMSDQAKLIRKGIHIVVATPGRLLDLVEKQIVDLSCCRYFCLDEADRMVDLGFETELRRILGHLPQDRQTLLFSATMPSTIKDFAKSALRDPVIVSVGRAGSASKTIKQEIEWVQPEGRLRALLDALQKTAPPVLIFSQSKWEVNDIQEYLLKKGVEAVAIHGSKTQEERSYAIDTFKQGEADVLVATDVASKGLDFPSIQHVINFDLPSEIEDYVHRIGRTGRGGKSGLATTFINSTCSEQILLDLKHLLLEAGQPLPTVLAELRSSAVSLGGEGCSVCGGLGHSDKNCPKLSLQTSKTISQMFGAGEAKDSF